MISTAIVGAGGIALKHAAALNRLPDVRVAAVLDPDAEHAKRIAALCGARVIGRLEEALEEIQTIHLLTPPSKRVEYARLAMEAGKHVLCEKPIASSLADAEELSRLAEKTGVIFMTAFNMRFRPGYRMLQQDALSGRLGKILSVWVHRIGPGSGFHAPLGDSWRTDPNLVCGMTIESLSHDIDMIRGLGLEIQRVSSWVKGSRPDLPAFDNNAQVLLGLSGGASGIINASWASHLPMCSRGVVGTKGTAALLGNGFFDFMSYRLAAEDLEYEQTVQVNDPFDGESYYTENRHFFDCVERREKPLVTEKNGLEALKVSLSILESARTGAVLEVGK